MTSFKEKRKSILRKNGFVYKNNVWYRDDGYELVTQDWKYMVCNWDWDLFYWKSEAEQMWYLVLAWLIIVYC